MSPGARAEAVSMGTAKAALGPPNTSGGSLYMLTENAATANQLSEIAAVPQDGVGANETAAVAIARMDAAIHTRSRALPRRTPRSIHCRESQPPANPPTPASTGGIHAYRTVAARLSLCCSTKYSVVKLVQRAY